MKTYKLTSEWHLEIAGKVYLLGNHGGTIDSYEHLYPAPYERNDLYYLLQNEMNPSTPNSNLEPASGMHLYADVDFEYNYYSEGYEAIGQPELNLHNAYAPSLNLWLMHETYSSPESLVTLDNNYQYAYDAIFKGFEDQLERFGNLSRDYFNTVLEYSYGMLVQQTLPDYEKGVPGLHYPQFINKDTQQIYLDRRNVREAFPMFTKFMLTGVEKSEFCTILEQAKLEDEFVEFLHEGGHLISGAEYSVENAPYETKTADILVHTYENFLDYLQAGTPSDVTSGTSSTETTCEYFESYIKSILAKKAIDGFISNHSLGHTFPVAFKLTILDSTGAFAAQYLNQGPIASHSKTYYFFNYDDMLEFRHYHTQAFYGHVYQYDVRVINGYIVHSPSAQQKELIFMNEVYYSEEVKILDSPPIAPDVELITYRGVDNKVLIMLNQMIDKKLMTPIMINEGDESLFVEQYRAQNIEEKDSQGKWNPIIFESDDPTDFQIFKTTKHPVSWDDFRNEHFRNLSSGVPKMSAASFVDTIIPNQSYYYMFRAEDEHGNVSNPSPIYEFILNKEGETLYPKIRIVDFAQPEPPTQKIKTFKKYLKIGFSPRQYQIPSDQVQNINDTLVNGDIDIGIADGNNIIGSDRVFKFRIRSKNTGKMIDINVTFKKNKVIKA